MTHHRSDTTRAAATRPDTTRTDTTRSDATSGAPVPASRTLLVGLGAAAALAGAALFNRARAARAEAEHPPHGQFIEVDGVRLHYIDRGSGSAVVLVHGNGVMLQDWEASGIVDRLAARYRVIAIDRPGFGYSTRPRTTLWTPSAQADLIHRALAQLGVERPIVVGHSFGALVTAALGVQHPQGVAALVLLSGYYFPTARADTVLLSPPAVPVVGDVMRYTVSPLLGRAITPMLTKRIFAPAPVAPSFAAFPIELALRPGQVRAAAADTGLMVPGAARLARRWRELKMPVAIVSGDGDKIANIGRQSERLHAQIAGSTLQRLPGAGHMLHHTAPDAVLYAIDQVAARN